MDKFARTVETNFGQYIHAHECPHAHVLGCFKSVICRVSWVQKSADNLESNNANISLVS